MISALWTLSWHFGLGGAGVLGALAFAWYSPVFKTTALWVAMAISIGLGCYATGVVNENAFWEAKWKTMQAREVARNSKARVRARAAVERGVRDPRDTDKR